MGFDKESFNKSAKEDMAWMIKTFTPYIPLLEIAMPLTFYGLMGWAYANYANDFKTQIAFFGFYVLYKLDAINRTLKRRG